MVAEDERLAEEKRERERERNRQRMVEELRQKDLEKKANAEQRANEKALENAAAESVDWAAIEDKMVARMSAIGAEFDALRTRVGVFQEAIVKDANASGFTIQHKDGEIEVAYGDLPADVQAKMLYDAEEAMAAAEGKPLPELSEARLQAVKDRVEEERHSIVEAESEIQDQTGDVFGEFDDTDSTEPEESALERRRRLANVLNEQVRKLSELRDAGFGAQHSAVREQKAVIAKLEQQVANANEAVMEERRRRINVPKERL